MKNRKNLLTLSLLVGCLLLLSACCGPNGLQNHVDQVGHIAGFWGGLWNGITAPFSFFGSLFSDHIGIYNVHNNGGWYNFGFVLGVGGGSGSIVKFSFSRTTYRR